MFKLRLALTIALTSSFWCVAVAHASLISYDVTSLGGTTWRYDYTIANDSLEVPVEEFTVYFEAGSFLNLRSPAGPSNWDVLAVEPDTALPDDGFFDALALIGGLMPGGAQNGFSIEFDFLGAGTPGSQFFEFLTASLDILDVGFTQLAAVPAPVPEPASGSLFAGALAWVAFRKLRRRTS
jgi:hypothetical protein